VATIKKFNLEKKYFIPALYVLAVICIAIAFEKTIGNVGSVWLNIKAFISAIISILQPFVYGLFIAYFTNPALSWLESHPYKGIKRPKLKRILSVITTYIIVIGGIVWIIAYLLPEVVVSIRNLIISISTPSNIHSLEQFWINNFGDSATFESILNSINHAIGTNYNIRDIVDLIFEPVFKFIGSLPNFVNTVVLQTVNAAQGILTFGIGMIIGFYMLCDKEKMQRAATKFIYVVFPGKRADRILDIGRESNDVFKKFFTGKVIDSTIIGILFFIISYFMGLSYPVLLSLIIGVTNMIPYFGPFIGAVPVVVIVLLTNYKMALWTIIAIFILQQFDGNILGPKILGDSTGLSPLGVVFSIIVGGAVFGVLGMFLGVPVFAVIVNLLSRFMNRKYNEKYTNTNLKD